MELFYGLLYYSIFSLFSVAGLPLTLRLTQKRALGWGSAKLVGFLLFAYMVWILSYFHLLDYQNYFSLVILCSLFLAAGAALLWKYPGEFFKKSGWQKEVVWTEALSLTVFLVYLGLRSLNPSANGTEHFMDMALLTAAGKTNFFPFTDPWYAGMDVNYYYYGHYLMGLIANLGRIPFGLAYNFALALIFTQSALLSGLLTYAITGLKKYGFLVGFLVTAAGTLFFSGCVFHGLISSPFRECSYPSSTRLYTPSYIINEIPSYSFTVGNLHAHVIGLPLFILNLILIYLAVERTKPSVLHLILLSFGMAASGLANSWDLISAASVFGTIIAIKTAKSVSWLYYGAATLLAAYVLMLPHLLHFSSPVLGIGFIPSFVRTYQLTGVQYPTPFLAIIGMWGVFLTGALIALVSKRKEVFNNVFLLSLLIVSVGILAGTELLFVKDIYSVANPPFFRANTTFKFGYNAWVMLSVAFGVFAAMIQERIPGTRYRFEKIVSGGLVFAAVFGGSVYSFEAVRQYYLKGKQHELDASRWMEQERSEDWAVVQFINKNFKERAVIAEAVGDSYTSFARISAFAGMITPMGWKTHEWTWRLDAEAAKKAAPGVSVETGWGRILGVVTDVEALYRTEDKSEAKRIIDKYGIDYVYVGELERQTYPGLQEGKFSELGNVVFESGESRLFEVK